MASGREVIAAARRQSRIDFIRRQQSYAPLLGSEIGSCRELQLYIGCKCAAYLSLVELVAFFQAVRPLWFERVWQNGRYVIDISSTAIENIGRLPFGRKLVQIGYLAPSVQQIIFEGGGKEAREAEAEQLKEEHIVASVLGRICQCVDNAWHATVMRIPSDRLLLWSLSLDHDLRSRAREKILDQYSTTASPKRNDAFDGSYSYMTRETLMEIATSIWRAAHDLTRAAALTWLENALANSHCNNDVNLQPRTDETQRSVDQASHHNGRRGRGRLLPAINDPDKLCNDGADGEYYLSLPEARNDDDDDDKYCEEDFGLSGDENKSQEIKQSLAMLHAHHRNYNCKKGSVVF